MDEKTFYSKLGKTALRTFEKALCVLWFNSAFNAQDDMTPGEITSVFRREGLGNPNTTQLRGQLKKSRLTLRGKTGFYLNPQGQAKTSEVIQEAMKLSIDKVELEAGYLPSKIWDKTRDYIEKTCIQVNGCYQFSFFDAASVMLRRVLETLLIESYEALKRDQEIKNADGDYIGLDDIISRATSASGLNLSRNAKKALNSKIIKKIGDLSAHNRRYNADKSILDRIHLDVLVIVQELISLAKFK